ncbi:MAG: hypothetical protein OXU20_21985 [Myxococcales bacterium]|nr:hypothetical protein [Myxococcales bacterium]
MTTQLPPCGLYRTTAAIGAIPSETLVYFHNHGDPGPGLYLPAGWHNNRAKISERGNTLPSPEAIAHLEPLPPEGFYRVAEPFHCCEKQCRRFEPETLVQLGYNGRGQALLFSPELIDGMLAVPERGTAIDHQHLARIRQLRVPIVNRPAAVS